jgi:tRNA dimethylallyltransferase
VTIILAGPTAVGKSAVALLLAERLQGEIVSVDSMQVYRGMDIGTAKAGERERERVPHHMIDVVEPAQWFDAAQFVSLARQAIQDIQGRNRVPILCGGTGLYFKALCEGLNDAPSANLALRAELEAVPLAALLQELAERDPDCYQRIARRNPRRVIRAVEVLRLTGKPIPQERSPAAPMSLPDLAGAFCFERSPEDLRARINERVERMFRDGLVAETERLLERGLAGNPTAMQALGYRQVAEHLRGERSLADTIELVKSRTRQLAKRQLTWFRRQMPMEWIALEPSQHEGEIADRLAGQVLTSSGRMSSGESPSPSGP